MNVKVSHLLASFAAVFLFAFSASAQDDVPVIDPQDPSHREYNFEDDKSLIYDHSIRYNYTSTTRDSIQAAQPATVSVIRPQVQPTKVIKSDSHRGAVKEQEDALSFNFLFYIIQKFKMSDLID